MAAPDVRVETNYLPTGKLVLVFSVLAFSLLVSFVDQNAVSVVLPVLAQDLHASSSISWAGTSSLIANTVFQVLYGRLSDIVGRKMILLVCIGLLVLGDLLCGFARTGPELYIYRGIAGVGNGGVAALSMMIVSDSVTLERRGRYQGILGACVGIGNVVGPFLAAAVTESWEWSGLFWIICILAVVGGLVVAVVVPPSRVAGGNPRHRLAVVDWWGIASSSGGTVLLLIPVSSANDASTWQDPAMLAMLIIGVALLIAFVVIEWRYAAMPLMPLKFFRNGPVCAIIVQNFLMGIVYYSNLYFLPVYFQSARQWSLMQAAILTIPFVASQSVLSVISGQYISAVQRYGEVIWCGYFCWVLGAGLTMLFGRETQTWVIVLVLIVEGAGVGMVFQPTLVAIQAHTASRDRAVITSVRNFSRSMGGAIGLAISTALFSSSVQSHITELPSEEQSDISRAILAVPDLSSASPSERDTVLNAYVAGSRSVFLLWGILQGICFVLCIFIKDRGLSRPEDAELREESVVDRSIGQDGNPIPQIAPPSISFGVTEKAVGGKPVVATHARSS